MAITEEEAEEAAHHAAEDFDKAAHKAAKRALAVEKAAAGFAHKPTHYSWYCAFFCFLLEIPAIVCGIGRTTRPAIWRRWRLHNMYMPVAGCWYMIYGGYGVNIQNPACN